MCKCVSVTSVCGRESCVCERCVCVFGSERVCVMCVCVCVCV